MSEEKDVNKETRKKIAQQMEFYFSDSNLSKDRFLKQEIQSAASRAGFVDLNVFLRFNKIRSLTNKVDIIAKSLKKSEFLELNEEKTMVKRKNPFVEPSQEETDRKTVYVENIKPKVKVNKLKSYFEQFGKVSYISMPKFQSSNEPKGFAFVEFESEENALNVVKKFKEMNMFDEKSVGKFPKTNAQIDELEKKINKIKDEINHINPKFVDEEPIEKNKDKQVKSHHQEMTKKSEEIKENPNIKGDDFQLLKVIPKQKWLLLKNDFLEKQKNEIQYLKQKLNDLTTILEDLKKAENEKKTDIDLASIKLDDIDLPDIDKGCILKISIDINDQAQSDLLNLTRQQFKQSLSNEIQEKIAYVDLDKSLNKIFLRCKSIESANSLLEDSTFMSKHKKELLHDDEERLYFQRISLNRNKKQQKLAKKFNKNTEAKSQVATEKPKKRQLIEETTNVNTSTVKTSASKSQSKHIKFDEDS